MTVPVLPVRYDNKVVLVTGASRGIGRVLASGFAAAGATTVFVARRDNELRGLESEIRQSGAVGHGISADFGDPNAVDKTVSDVIDAHGAVDVLVNNVGVAGPIGNVEDTPLNDWEQTLAVNLTSAFMAVRAVVPAMKARRSGSILNIGSINGKTPFPFRSAYAATKMGMIGLTRTLAAELGAHEIRVNCILPANVAGERVEEILAAQAAASGTTVDEARESVLKLSPLHTQVAPESILNVALFLASDHARHMTGQDINVTAGMLMY